ncbi:MAG TPA: EsaB/YukD family protein, partial [Mycobacterium sp.]|nr:EsaB/YukD family protein [Mycobacterium sp.]
MTGASELRNAEAVSAAPEAIRVSVLGGRTQLDVALPADVPVAAFVPDLARLIGSRDYRHGDDVTDHDERRTFWVLCHVDTDTDTDTELAPDETLRSAGIANGELLRMTARRALSPPTLYDDVVDAAARLNRAAYAAWDATAAGVMAFAGLWLCAAVWVYFLMADALSAHRSVVVIGAALTAVTMVAGAGLVHRGLGRTEIATAFAAPTLALSAALGWVAAEPLGAYGLAAAGLSLLMLTAVYYRIVGTGHQFYIATAMLFAFGGLALLGRATGARADVVATLAATSATLGCLAVQPLTARLARLPASTALPAAPPHDRPFDNPFSAAGDAESQAAMPTAEEVWARVRS